MDEIKANTLDSYLIVISTLQHCYYFWCNSLQLGFQPEIATIYWPPPLKTCTAPGFIQTLHKMQTSMRP